MEQAAAPRPAGDFALVGLFKAHEKDSEARCPLLVIDLRRSDVVHCLRMKAWCQISTTWWCCPACARPAAIGIKTDEIRRVISVS